MADQTTSSSAKPEQLEGIVQPHANDVLSGRGNFVNHHTGNENFRALVKHHKKAYVACPKNQKAIYSKLIYDEIRSMNPPGRFLKQDPKTKLWSDVGEKKALDKTRQALREGAPELLKELEGNDTASTEYKFENQDALGPLRAGRQNNPLANSLMGNISLGSFSLNSLDPQRATEASTPPVPGIPGQIQTNNSGLTQEGANALLVAATQMQLQQQQQQQQQQQLQFLQQQAGNINPAQLQLLQNHLQQQQQQQQQPNSVLSGAGGNNNMFLGGNNGGYDAALAAAQASSNMGSEQVAALLNAIHNHASNNSASDLLQQQLTQQLLTQNLLNQMNNSSSTTPSANLSINTTPNVQHGFHFNQNNAQHEDSTVSANSMGGTTSRARAQRIGLKNSFTQQRRPNRNLKNNEQALMGNSLMSVESINMDQLRMSGVSLGEFSGSEMCKLFESDRELGKKIEKTDDVSEVSDAMSEDAMSEDEKETSKAC